MARAELQWETWQTLDEKRQEFIVRQLARYFLSPLLYLDGIVPVEVNDFGEHFRTYDLFVSGEWLRFIPGMRGVNLGASDAEIESAEAQLLAVGTTFDQAREQLSQPVTVDLSPMLVGKNAISTKWRVIGQVNALTHAFAGDAFAYANVRSVVEGLLSPHVKSPTDFSGLEPVLSAQEVELRQVDPEHYQVALQADWDFVKLQRRLSGYGFSLPDEREYEYLIGGGLPGIFPWGKKPVATLPNYLPNRFGLNVAGAREGGELVINDVVKSAAVDAASFGANGLALSPYYRTEKGDFSRASYRKIVRVHLD